MKRLISVLIATTCLFLLCACGIWGFLSKEKTLKEKAEESLGLSLESTIVLEEWDTHGGFHGDGETFIKMSCVDGFEECLDVQWRILPLDGDAYRYFYEWGAVFEHPETGEKVIPEVENGYWYFKETGAMNWEFALFDCEEDILYFYIFDA